MNNLDHVKGFYPENYKLDLSETMKAALSKGPNQIAIGGINKNSAVIDTSTAISAISQNELSQSNSGISGVGYVTEKLYMLLQLYLQNNSWNPSAELVQCFSELKDNPLLPSSGYLQVVANRLTLDSQGRLILRENGKIVLPFEHFANAVMLKHMSGPHGLHLSVEATLRAVIESYTIGRDNFGMEKEFIIEVVQSCPSPACRYYKNHIGISPLPFLDHQFGISPTEFLQHLPHLPPPTPHISHSSTTTPCSVSGTVSTGSASTSSTSSISSTGTIPTSVEIDLSKNHTQQKLHQFSKQQQNQLSQLSAAAAVAAVAQQSQREHAVVAAVAAHHHQQLQVQQQAAVVAAAAAAKHQQKQQHQLTTALIQQQNRVLAQQSLEKFNNLSTLEKQKILQHLDSKQIEPMALAAAAANLQMQGLIQSQSSIAALSSSNSSSSSTPSCISTINIDGTIMPTAHNLPQQIGQPLKSSPSSAIHSSHLPTSFSLKQTEQLTNKNLDILRSDLESLESNKDLLALHNGAWTPSDLFREILPLGQDKIVKIFAELMRNMGRMKSYIRPSMCKPYGKQSESLQKTLLDTIQIVQTLRNCLPASHIPVASWRSESEINVGNVSTNGSNVSISGSGICTSKMVPPGTNLVNGGNI